MNSVQRTFLHFQFHLIPLSSPTSLKLYFSSCYVENFEVRVRVRSATGQKARMHAKCVRVKVVKCGVRACGQKSIAPNTLTQTQMVMTSNIFTFVSKNSPTRQLMIFLSIGTWEQQREAATQFSSRSLFGQMFKLLEFPLTSSLSECYSYLHSNLNVKFQFSTFQSSTPILEGNSIHPRRPNSSLL